MTKRILALLIALALILSACGETMPSATEEVTPEPVVTEEATPDPTTEATTPEPTTETATPEPTTEVATPDPTPEPSTAEATPEPTGETATPEPAASEETDATASAEPTADIYAEVREQAREDMAGAVNAAASEIERTRRDDLESADTPFDSTWAWDSSVLTESQLAYIDSAASYIVENMPSELSTYDKYRYLAFVLSVLASYDYDTHDDTLNETPYGALAEHRAICMGYTNTMLYLCEKANLYCVPVSGIALWNGGDHGWNIAMLPEGSYYMDITWCDQYGDISTSAWAEMFMVTEERMAEDHGEWDSESVTGTVSYWP